MHNTPIEAREERAKDEWIAAKVDWLMGTSEYYPYSPEHMDEALEHMSFIRRSGFQELANDASFYNHGERYLNLINFMRMVSREYYQSMALAVAHKEFEERVR